MKEWISNDYPLMTETEKQEYDMLKKSATWLCICCSKQIRDKAVHFSPDVLVHEIDNLLYEPCAYKEARQDPYLSAKITFQADIMRAEKLLSPILSNEHREKVRQTRKNRCI